MPAQTVSTSVLDRLLFHLGKRLCNRRNRDDNECYDSLRNEIGSLIAHRVNERIHSLRCIGGEEDHAGCGGEEETPKYADNVTDLQAIFFLMEKACQTERAECERVVEQHLRDRVENRFCDKLHQTVSDGGHNADIRTVPVGDQHDKEHGEQRHRAAHRHFKQLDHGTYDSQCDSDGRVDKLLGREHCFFAGIALAHNGSDDHKRGDDRDDDSDAERRHMDGAVTPGAFRRSKKVIHKKILLVVNMHRQGDLLFFVKASLRRYYPVQVMRVDEKLHLSAKAPLAL